MPGRFDYGTPEATVLREFALTQLPFLAMGVTIFAISPKLRLKNF